MIYRNSKEALAFQNPLVTKIKQKRYIKYFNKDELVVDLGCGNGLFLELLKENSIKGIGIDILADSIKNCKDKQFEAYEDDVINFLKNFNKTVDGIFCSHIVEHLLPQDLVELFSLAYKCLLPNGKFIIITPNPKDLNVLRDIFWQDISHIRPYPLLALENLGITKGFSIIDKGEEPVFFNPFIKGTNRKGILVGYLKKILSFGLFNRGDLFIVMQKPL